MASWTNWGTDKEASFSQFAGKRGKASYASDAKGGAVKVTDKATPGVRVGDRSCVEVDGAEVYGSKNEAGWFDAFRRIACPLAGGHYLLIDAFSAKKGRKALVVKGRWGGPSFDETKGGAVSGHAALDVDTYFHTDVEKELINTANRTDRPFDRDGLKRNSGKECRHVDASVRSSEQGGDMDDVLRLLPRCGLGYFRGTDGVGAVAGWARGGGSFVYVHPSQSSMS